MAAIEGEGDGRHRHQDVHGKEGPYGVVGEATTEGEC